MERLLHYVWQHRIYAYGSLHTTGGKPVEVISPGLHNNDAGPDFIDAKLKIGDELWAGNIEIHMSSSDWKRHHHNSDMAYDNVVLHVVDRDDCEVFTSKGRKVEQLVLHVPSYVEQHYNELFRASSEMPCYRHAVELPAVVIDSWMDRLATERLEDKTSRIVNLAERLGGDWESALFVTLARSFGFGINSDAFEEWGMRIPLMAAGKHRDDIFQIESLFLGQAGLLDEAMLPSVYYDEAMREGYFKKLQTEYGFLANKFSLQPMNGARWRFLRMRPQNFPHIRLAQLAHLYVSRQVSVSSIIGAETLDDARRLFVTAVTPYWQTHYVFGSTTTASSKNLREASVDSLLINAVVPMLYAYGLHRCRVEYCDRALQFLEQIKPENNHIIRLWLTYGMPIKSAADSQALIQLRKQYCDRKDCLRCRFGTEYLKTTHVYHVLQEPKK